MGGEAVAAEESLDRRLRNAQVDGLADREVAHGAEVPPVGDVTVAPHLAPVDPFVDLVGRSGQ